MNLVRVTDETLNLSHSSNPISTIRLRNSSTSLMRSIRARGHTHCWVVHAFLLREQERGKFFRRETTFAGGENASQGN
jgi:hypothetical protein